MQQVDMRWLWNVWLVRVCWLVYFRFFLIILIEVARNVLGWLTAHNVKAG